LASAGPALLHSAHFTLPSGTWPILAALMVWMGVPASRRWAPLLLCGVAAMMPATIQHGLALSVVYAVLAFAFTLGREQQIGAVLAAGARVMRLADPAAAPERLPTGPPFCAMKIVLIAYFYPPHNEIGAARPSRFAEYLRRRNADVRVICSSDQLRRAEDQLLVAEGIGGYPCRTQPGDGSTATRLLSRALHQLERIGLPYQERLAWFPGAYQAASRAMTAHGVVISTHPPVVTHLVALALKLRFGRPWIADFRDPLWGNPSRTALRASILDPVIERLVMTASDAVIANTDASADLLRARYPRMADKIHTIWNGFDPEDVMVPIDLLPHSRRSISHVGTLYGARSPVRLVQSIRRLMEQGALPMEGWQFRQVGRIEPHTPTHAALLELAESGRVHLSPRHLPVHLAREEMLTAHVLLLLDMNDTNPGLQVPAKLFEYVRTGRPILALTPPGSATSRVLAIAAVPHVCIDIDTPSALFDASVLAFLTMSHPATAPSVRFRTEFSAPAQVDTLVRLLDAVSRSPSSAIAAHRA